MATPALTTVQTKGGARFTVAKEHAPQFEALLNDLEAAGVEIKGDQSGGYNPRNIAGTNTPSQHSFGRAIDVNWSENPRGAPGKMPADIARQLAEKHGFVWGGDWSNPDPMHFEVSRSQPVPVRERGLTTFAGVPQPTTQPSQVARTEPDMDPIMAMIASIFGGGGGGAPGGGTPVPAGGGGGSAPVPQFGSMQPPQGGGVDPQNKLATDAMASAQGGNQSNLLASLQQMPGFDPSRLRQIIGQRMKLGV